MWGYPIFPSATFLSTIFLSAIFLSAIFLSGFFFHHSWPPFLPRKRMVLAVRDHSRRRRHSVGEVVHRRNLDHVPRLFLRSPESHQIFDVLLKAIGRIEGQF